jgi:hypothetical protein
MNDMTEYNEMMLMRLVESNLNGEIVCKRYGGNFFWMDTLDGVRGIRVEVDDRDLVGKFIPAKELDLKNFEVVVPISVWSRLLL